MKFLIRLLYLMLRSRGRKSLDLCGFQSAKTGKQRKDTFPPQIRVLLRNKSTAKELISYGSFQSGTQHGIYRNEQPPLTQQGAYLESKGLPEQKIAKLFNTSRSTIQYRRTSSFELLRKYLEENADEWDEW